MRSVLAGLVIGVALTSAFGQGSVYRCVGVDGRTVLQQTQCAGPIAGGDSRQVDGALRNAGGDAELAATIKGCKGVTKESPQYSKCSAVVACSERGLVGSDLRACIRDSSSQFAQEQKIWQETQKRIAEETAEMAQKDNPRQFIRVGQVYNNQDLSKLIDAKYPGTTYYPNQSFAIPYNGIFYVVKTEKVSNTDVPAKYRIVSMKRENSKPPKPERRVPEPTAQRATEPVSCYALSKYAEMRGHNFIERAAIVKEAREEGNCY